MEYGILPYIYNMQSPQTKFHFKNQCLIMSQLLIGYNSKNCRLCISGFVAKINLFIKHH